MKPVVAAIALGSNVGDRRAMIAGAIAAMERFPRTHVRKASRLIETDAVGPGVQGRYLNAAALLETTLTPRELLEHLLAAEKSLGRVRQAGERWGPRTIDLDLLLFGDRVIEEPGLGVPHPRLHERRFVLEPLVEIAPGMIHPSLKRTVEELLAALDVGGR